MMRNSSSFVRRTRSWFALICRDDEKHRGHEFKPIKEADGCRKSELNDALNFLLQDNSDIDSLSRLQDLEIKNTQAKAKRLRAEIHSQFEEMRSFLSQKEKEVIEELKGKEADALAIMSANKVLIERKLENRKKMEATLLSALDIAGADSFLQWWSEEGHLFMLELKKKDSGNGKTQLYESRAKDLWVTTDSFSLDAYETHLQYFMWKEMLRTIRSGSERLTLKANNDPYLKVCPDGSGVRQVDRQSGYLLKIKEPAADYRGTAVSEETFGTGKRYLEVDVGEKLDWGVGVKGDETDQKELKEEKQLFLKHDKGYTFTDNGFETAVDLSVKSKKIGIYLDCESRRVSFYNADTMSLIHSANCSFFCPLAVCLSSGVYLDGLNSAPLTVCWY